MRRPTWWRIALWKLMRRFASAQFLVANYPDLCDERPGDWVVLQRGAWGTLAFTPVGDRRLVTIWQGYEQKGPGVLLTEADIKVMLRSYAKQCDCDVERRCYAHS